MSLTDTKIKLAYRKLLFSDDTDVATPLTVKKTSDQDTEETVTSLAIDISGNAATATTSLDGITIASSVTDLVDVSAAGSGLIITDAERIQYDEAYSHSYNLFNPHGVSADDVELGNVENVALTSWAGNTAQTSVGTIITGVWQATAIADAYIASGAIWNAKQDALTFNAPSSDNANPSTSAQIKADLDLKEPIHGTGLTAGQIIDWTSASAGTIDVSNYTNTTYISSDFDHDQLTNAGGNQHIDWTLPSAGTINADNYTDTNTTYVSSDFTHNDLTGHEALEHIRWDQTGSEKVHKDRIYDTFQSSVESYADADAVWSAILSSSIQEGDVVIISSTQRSYVRTAWMTGSQETMFLQFLKLIEPLDAITSVNGEIGDIVLTHDGFSDFVANEHIDWTQASVGTIDATNISELQGLTSNWTDGGSFANTGDHGHTIQIQDASSPASGDSAKRVSVIFRDNIGFDFRSEGRIYAADGNVDGTASYFHVTDHSKMGFHTSTWSSDIRIANTGASSAETPGTMNDQDPNYRWSSLNIHSANSNNDAFISFSGYTNWNLSDPGEWWNVGRDAYAGTNGEGAFVISYGNRMGFDEMFAPAYYEFLKIDEGTTGDITTLGKINSASPTELGYLSGVSSNIQTQFSAISDLIDSELAAFTFTDTDITDTGKYVLTDDPPDVSWGNGEANAWKTGNTSLGGSGGNWLSHTGIIHLRRGDNGQLSYIALDAGSHEIMFAAEYDGGGSGNSEAVFFRAHMSGDVAFTHELASGNEILDWTQDLSATKTIPIANVEFTSGAIITGLEEEIQDVIGAMLTGTQSGIVVTYGDSTGELDFDVSETSIDHNTLQNYVADEHIDWTTAYTTNLMCGSARIGGGEGSRSIMIDNFSEAGTIKFEGVDQDAWETTLTVEEPTQDRVVKLPDATGTLALLTDLSSFITDYTVTQSDVTDQEDHITITESQISDLGSYLTSETSHTDVVVDGDFASAGFMKSDGAGTYSMDNSTYLTSFTETNDLSSAVTWTNIPIANVPTGTSNVTVALGDHNHSGTYLESFTETNDLSAAVTWTDVPTANITFDSVTQHAAQFKKFIGLGLTPFAFNAPSPSTFKTSIEAIEPSADRTITFPNNTGTVALTESSVMQRFTGYVGAGGFQTPSTAGGVGNVIMNNIVTNAATEQAGGFGFYGLIFNGSYRTNLTPIQPTQVNFIELPDDSGTVALTGTSITQIFNGVVQTNGKLRIGAPGTNHNMIIDNANGGEIIWDGATGSDLHQTKLRVEDPTNDDNLILLPDQSGTIALLSDIGASHTQGTDTGTTNANFGIRTNTTGSLFLIAHSETGDNSKIYTLQAQGTDEHVTMFLPSAYAGSQTLCIQTGTPFPSFSINDDTAGANFKVENPINEGTAGKTMTLQPFGTTDDRIIKLPDDSGIVALTGTVSLQRFAGTVEATAFQAGTLDGVGAVTVTSVGGVGTILFEGATADGWETLLYCVDPTEDNSIVLPDSDGTILLDTDIVDDDTFGSVAADTVASTESIKEYADLMLPLVGGTMSGHIDMGIQQVRNVGAIEWYYQLNGAVAITHLDGDQNLGGPTPSHAYLPTQRAVKKYIDGEINKIPSSGELEWYYYGSNLAVQDRWYSEKWNDEYGVSQNIHADLATLGYNTTAINSAWRMIRSARRVPYRASINKFMVLCESSGAAFDSVVEVALWRADGLPDNTQYTSGQNLICEHLATLTFTFTSISSWMTQETATFTENLVEQADYLFVTLKKTSSGDGSSFHVHSQALFTSY